METATGHNGYLILTGGDDTSEVNSARSRSLLQLAPEGSVAVLSTAAAFEGVQNAEEAALRWCSDMGRTAEVFRLLQHHEVTEEAAKQIENAALIFVCDGSPLHLRSVVKRSPLMDAFTACLNAGGVVYAAGATGTLFGDPMVDPRGGAYTVGLGVAPSIAVLPTAFGTHPQLWDRAKELCPDGVSLVGMEEGAALVRHHHDWNVVGDGGVVVWDGAGERRYSPSDSVPLPVK